MRTHLLLTLLLAASTAHAQVQVGSDIIGNSVLDQSGIAVSISDDGSIIAVGASLLSSGISAGNVRVFSLVSGNWVQLGSNITGEAAGDFSGNAVSLSANGNRVAIGSKLNSENGNEDAGHARVYQYNGSSWTQMGTDIDGEGPGDQSGTSISLSSDGSRVIVGAPLSQDNGQAGHARVFQFNGSSWVQLGADLVGESATDRAGSAVAISGDGSRVAVGAPENDGGGIGSGHVRVYAYNGSSWTQVGSDLDGAAAGDQFGFSVSLSHDGSRVAAGAIGNDAGGDNAGHVRVFESNGGTWSVLGSAINGVNASDVSGFSVSLSNEGARLAIGARGQNLFTGQVRIFDLNGNAWTQVGMDINGGNSEENFGYSNGLAGDGSRVIIGAPFNDGNGIDAGRTQVYGGLPLGVSDNDFGNDLLISSNPTQGTVFVRVNGPYSRMTSVVRNVTGQLVHAQEFVNEDVLEIHIDGAPGLYFLDLMADPGRKAVFKVVKE